MAPRVQRLLFETLKRLTPTFAHYLRSQMSDLTFDHYPLAAAPRKPEVEATR
jgi:hypothetical protein